MPTVFVHDGYSPYLEFSLRQARAADPDADIVLLGDASNDRFPFVRHVDGASGTYLAAGGPLRERYRHLSTNRRAFELICFERWFRLQALFDAEGWEDALVLDSDVMLYATEAEIRETWLEGKTLAVDRPVEQEPFRWLTSAGISYWTRASLDAFCTFILDAYGEGPTSAQYAAKWRHHVEHGIPGGVCDMTALHLFVDGYDPEGLVNLSEVRDGVTCDQNTIDSENLYPGEYRMAGGVKAMTWDAAGRPHGDNLRLGRPVRFQVLHFAGKSKALMPAAYRGPAFPGQRAAARALRFHYAARRAASALLRPVRRVAQKLSPGG
ncbi:MAG TPA: hypothetical protein VF576_07240 [Rubricoccaceae bacterium]|jgi:hypothetical protein